MVLFCGTIGAYKALNKEDALTHWQTYKPQREDNIKKAIYNIQYRTPKTCTVRYESGDVDCYVCYNFSIDGSNYEDCAGLNSDTTEVEDDNEIRENVKNYIEAIYPIEEIEYIERDIKGKVITIDQEVVPVDPNDPEVIVQQYNCVDTGVTRACPDGLSGGLRTRCYYANKIEWYTCSSGWVEV